VGGVPGALRLRCPAGGSADRAGSAPRGRERWRAGTRYRGRLLSEIVAGRGAAHPDVELRHGLVTGHPVEKLAEASAHALALVVGSRGRGGFTGMLLDSVSQDVLRHAHCPVIVVPRGAGGD
jgi:nucleotide-binding universal stress UspA family protein